MTSPADSAAPSAKTDHPVDVDVAAVTEAFALLTAGELVAFARLADDAAHAPELRARITLSRIAASDLEPLEGLREHVRAVGIEPDLFDDRTWQFRETLTEIDARTTPRDWWERLVRTYIGYGVFADLEREVVAGLSGESGRIARDALADGSLADVVVAMLRPVIETDPQLRARLALWGRRVVGEALGVASRLLHSRPELARLVGIPVGQPGAAEALASVLGRLTAEHARRMRRLDLTA